MVTIDDRKTENCHGKAKFTSAEGCTDTWTQQAHKVDHRFSFLSLTTMVRPCPLYWDWSSFGAQSAINWLMLHLEFGGRVSSNLGAKMELSEQEPRTASS
jgi:hypothetical protein